MRVLVSAGEASGEMYAAGVVRRLRHILPRSAFYGCAGPALREAGVDAVVDASKLSVVGLAEVLTHLPRIYSEYRKLVRFARDNPPDAALLVDNPDFNLRLARHLKRLNIPVFYLVAPQVWAWRQNRVKTIRSLVDKLFCLFPFEEAWFRERGVDAEYIGHPLVNEVSPSLTRAAFFSKHELPPDRPLVVLLPGSRVGEARRHLPVLLDTIELLRRSPPVSTILAVPKGFNQEAACATFRERIRSLSIQVLENETWDSIAHADLALAASGTVTIEAAVLGTPMVTFYKVTDLSWFFGRRLVKVPFLSMVNLIAGRAVVPELIQKDMTAANLAAAASSVLCDGAYAQQMRSDLAAVRAALTLPGDPLSRAANVIATIAPPRGEFAGAAAISSARQ